MSKYKFETLQIHAGHRNDPTTGAVATPLYQTSAYAFKNVEHGRRIFALEEDGNIYSRLTNPTNSVFEERIAALEGGVAAVSTSSGMAAIFLTIQTLAEAGDNIVSSTDLYGGSYSLFKGTLPKLGINVRFADVKNPQSFENLIDSKTKAVYVETIANSDLSTPDFEKISAIAKRHDVPLIVDNTVACGGYLCRPIEFGANIVVHSATKWINGHGNSIGGIIVDGGNFNWDNGKFPTLSEPNEAYHGLSFSKSFGASAFAVKARAIGLRDFGCCLSPFNAFLALTGVETLSLRAERICENSLKIAEWLEKNPKVEKVLYPGLESHPTHAQAEKYLHNGFGGIIFFDLKADRKEAGKVVDNLKIFTLLANIGDNKSLVAHPATTIHSQLTDKELEEIGIGAGTLRLSIGIENVDDLINDLSEAFSVLD